MPENFLTRGTRASLLLLLAACLAWAGGVPAAEPEAQAALPVHRPEVLGQYPHDPNAFTQGLAIAGGRLYEGTGRNGQSSLRRVDLESGEVVQRRNLGSRYFGEGITVMGGKVYQLTWQSHTGFVYDLESFEQLDTFYLPGEGWGLTHDGEHLIVSDGSATLRFLDPGDYSEVKRVEVRGPDGSPVSRLNELEYIDGEVWANIWYEDFILRIDPQSGAVNSVVDLRGLYEPRSSEAVLNGIAWDQDNGRLFVTGKLWPQLFEIRVSE